MPPPALQLTSISKKYGALRPLRVRSLVVQAGERVAIQGLDAAAAEVLLNLITGATLPDEGDVRVLGESTRALKDERAWFAWIDRLGIVSPRAVLLDNLTARQNLAMPLTLDIEPLPDEVAKRVAELAFEVGVPDVALDAPLAAQAADIKARVHLGRALALDPHLLLLEHPTALLGADAAGPFATDVAHVTRARHLSVLVVTEDRRFAVRVADRSLRLDAATGELRAVGAWRRWL